MTHQRDTMLRLLAEQIAANGASLNEMEQALHRLGTIIEGRADLTRQQRQMIHEDIQAMLNSTRASAELNDETLAAVLEKTKSAGTA